MCVASTAQDLGALHEERSITLRADIFRCDRRPETRPSGMRIELGRRAEERIAATYAAVKSRRFPLVVLVLEGCFRAFFARYMELLWRQQLPPFGVALYHFRGGDGAFFVAGVIELDHCAGRVSTRSWGRIRCRFGPRAVGQAECVRHRQPEDCPDKPPAREELAAATTGEGTVHHYDIRAIASEVTPFWLVPA